MSETQRADGLKPPDPAELYTALQDISKSLEPVVAGSRDTRKPRLLLDMAKRMMREGKPWQGYLFEAQTILGEHSHG